MDAIDFINKNFKIYKVNLSNDSEVFNNIKINSNYTYQEVCKTGKRPRINFEELSKQLDKYMELVYKGSFNF